MFLLVPCPVLWPFFVLLIFIIKEKLGKFSALPQGGS